MFEIDTNDQNICYDMKNQQARPDETFIHPTQCEYSVVEHGNKKILGQYGYIIYKIIQPDKIPGMYIYCLPD